MDNANSEIGWFELHWHDAELIRITINRELIGNVDEIKIAVRWPTTGEIGSVIFLNCFDLEAGLHFRYVGQDVILETDIVRDSDRLREIKALHDKTGVAMNNLKCYQIRTNMGSALNIYAEGFKVDKSFD